MKMPIIDVEAFTITKGSIAGEEVSLITPKTMWCNWKESDLVLRSSIWNKDGDLISAGYKKFFNWAEHPAIDPLPISDKGYIFTEKIDGSCLIVSKYKGELIIRTRGTFSATKMANGNEVDYLINKYPKAFSFERDTPPFSRIFEWTTPTNKIVLDYGSDPELWLTGIIFHDDYSYEYQEHLDQIAVDLGVKRPKTYKFDTLAEMQDTVHAFKGIEGVCTYYNNGQSIRKVKGVEYLAKHRFKSMVSMETTIDLYFQYGQPDFKAFETLLITEFDYECYEMVRGFASKIAEAKKEVVKIIEHMRSFVTGLTTRGLSRKDMAQEIIQAYGSTNRASFAFTILDNREIKEDGIKKLIYQCLKK